MFAYLSTEDKTKRILQLWNRCFTKLSAANLLILKLKDLRMKVRVQGRYNQTKQKLEIAEVQDLSNVKWIILPNNKWKRSWNLWIGVLLIYTGIFVPLRVAFYDDTSLSLLIFECFVDFCFIVDIVLTFFTAYEKHNVIETRHK